MVLELPSISRSSSEPLVEQIARHYQSAIQHGRLRPGDRLPTIRAVADQLQVTRNTVQEAYRRLSETGLVSASVGRGTEVTGGHGVTSDRGVFSPGARAALRQLETAPQAPAAREGTIVVANFAELLPDQHHFPVAEFRDSLERVFQRRGSDLLVYGQPAGDAELRKLLARRRECADDVCDPEEVLITSGAQQGIDLVLRTFTAPGDAVAVAVPTYHHLFGLFRAHGLELVPVATGPSGIDLHDVERVLARPGIRLLYLMPTFHNPTGWTMGLEQREELIEILSRTEVPVLEDEFQRELRFAGDPLPSLRALDPRALTVTVRTFSKGLFPGVRTGWVQASPKILGPMSALKRYTDLETSPLVQAALADFMTRGVLDTYLTELRAELARRHEAAQAALAEHMPAGSSWTDPEGGFALWIDVPPGIDTDRLADFAADRGVLVTPGRVFDPQAAPSSGLRLSLSQTSPEQVAHGIEILGACARDWIARAHPMRQRNVL